jgi:RHS repeat-associated protein
MDLRFPGQWFQLENGLAYNWHRHYDPTIGRYIQPDPLGLEALLSDGPSAYNYVGENPLVYIDETGEFLWLPAIAVVATAILWPEPANAPRQKDPIFPNNPLEPYIVGAAAGFCEFAWTGREIKFSSNFRVAPFGNRTGHLQGRWPHYHRRGTNEGQGIGRHRPWETKSVDQSFWDRF